MMITTIMLERSEEFLDKKYDETRQAANKIKNSKKRIEFKRQFIGHNSTINISFLLLISLTTLVSITSAWIVDFNNPIVHTQYGSIRGKIDERKTKFNKRPICTFLSIPYARPPVGSNRFLVSERLQPYNALLARII